MLELKQSLLHCPSCGWNLWIATRTAYNLDTKTWEQKDTTAHCERCEKGKHLQVLKAAEKVVPLKEEKRKA